jgi:hypothetical protein
MASQAQITAFVNEYAPYAETAAQATGLNAQLILAEWGNEVAYGTAWSEKNNIGNIGVYSGGPNPSYATIGEGVQAYINEIKSIPSIMATAGQSLAAQAEAIGNSPYASGHYLATGSNVPGSALIQDANVIASAGVGTASSVPPRRWRWPDRRRHQGLEEQQLLPPPLHQRPRQPPTSTFPGMAQWPPPASRLRPSRPLRPPYRPMGSISPRSTP